MHKLFDRCNHKVDHVVTKPWIDADPEGVVGNDVGIGKRANHPMRKIRVGRLAQQVAAEQEAGADSVVFDVLNQFQSTEGRVGSHRDCKAKPTRIRVGGCLGQDEYVFKLLEPVVQALPVVAAGVDEAWEFLKLGHANSGLHVSHFEVVANV